MILQLIDFTLFLLACLKFYFKTSGTMTFYIKHHENLLHFISDLFLTYVLQITSSVPMEDFSLNFKVFILIITCLVVSLQNERFVVTVQKLGPKGSYWIKLFLSSFYSFCHLYNIFVSQNITFYSTEKCQLHCIIIWSYF